MSSDSAFFAEPPHPDSAPPKRLRPVLRATAIAGSAGLAGLAGLMRPDYVAPGPGRTMYRIAFGGLIAASTLLSTAMLPRSSSATMASLEPAAADDPDDASADALAEALSGREDWTIELGAALTAGVLSAAVFDARIPANWWDDRLLRRLGVSHPRSTSAVLGTAFCAGAAVLPDLLRARALEQAAGSSDAGLPAADALRTNLTTDAPSLLRRPADPDVPDGQETATATASDTDGTDEEVEGAAADATTPLGGRREIELTDDIGAIVRMLITGESANARIMREQLAGARFFTWKSADRIGIDAPDTGSRLVPHTHTHSTHGLYTADGVDHIITLEIVGGRLSAVDISPLATDDDPDPAFEWDAPASLDDWPSPAIVTVRKDER